MQLQQTMRNNAAKLNHIGAHLEALKQERAVPQTSKAEDIVKSANKIFEDVKLDKSLGAAFEKSEKSNPRPVDKFNDQKFFKGIDEKLAAKAVMDKYATRAKEIETRQQASKPEIEPQKTANIDTSRGR